MQKHFCVERKRICKTPRNSKGFEKFFLFLQTVCDKKSYKQLFSIASEPIVPSIVA